MIDCIMMKRFRNEGPTMLRQSPLRYRSLCKIQSLTKQTACAATQQQRSTQQQLLPPQQRRLLHGWSTWTASVVASTTWPMVHRGRPYRRTVDACHQRIKHLDKDGPSLDAARWASSNSALAFADASCASRTRWCVASWLPRTALPICRSCADGHVRQLGTALAPSWAGQGTFGVDGGDVVVTGTCALIASAHPFPALGLVSCLVEHQHTL